MDFISYWLTNKDPFICSRYECLGLIHKNILLKLLNRAITHFLVLNCCVMLILMNIYQPPFIYLSSLASDFKLNLTKFETVSTIKNVYI